MIMIMIMILILIIATTLCVNLIKFKREPVQANVIKKNQRQERLIAKNLCFLLFHLQGGLPEKQNSKGNIKLSLYLRSLMVLRVQTDFSQVLDN